MAGIPSAEYEVLDHLKNNGWELYSMDEFSPKLFAITTWCRNTLGPMLVNYELDYECRWYGAVIEVPSSPFAQTNKKCIFAFKDPADYTLLKLKWTGID